MTTFATRILLGTLALAACLLATQPASAQYPSFGDEEISSPVGRWIAKVDRDGGKVEYLGIDLRQDGSFLFLVLDENYKVTQRTEGDWIYRNHTLTLVESDGKLFGRYNVPTLTRETLVVGSLKYVRIKQK